MKTFNVLLAGATALGLAAPIATHADTYGYSSNAMSFVWAAALANGFVEAAEAAGHDVILLDSKGRCPQTDQ